MVREKLTLVEAVNRVDGLVDFYSKEKIRLEDNLTKLLLPAGLTFTAAMLKDAIDPKYVGAAIFLCGFFLFYALLIYCDLFAAERLNVNALALQNSLNMHRDEDGAQQFTRAVPDSVVAYEKVESKVGRRHYATPTGKPLLALAGGAVALLIYSLVK